MSFCYFRNFISSIFMMGILCLNTAVSQDFNYDISNFTHKAQITLIAEEATAKAGEKIHLALNVKLQKGWHIYFENAGGAGFPLTLDWGDEGHLKATKILFPTPVVLSVGGIASYLYEDHVVLMTSVTVPDGHISGDLILKAHASYLICDDKICVPEDTDVSAVIPMGEGGIDKLQKSFFESARAKMAQRKEWLAEFFTDETGGITVEVKLPSDFDALQSAYIFPRTVNLIQYEMDQEIIFAEGMLSVKFKQIDSVTKTELFDFILKLTDAKGNMSAVDLQVKRSPKRINISPDQSIYGAAEGHMGLLTALFFAFLGGLILNLMPCVFPILSMKALSLASLAQKSPSAARESGHFYTLGVVVCFALIAVIFISLRMAGELVGWGFQMQMPLVNLGLGLVMVLVGLNLLGVFEVGSGFGGVGQELVTGSPRRSSFFTGFLAVIVATPCTAPFMASAMGYGAFAPALHSFFIFIFLALGLALPYLLLSYSSSFRKILPRPGAWMLHFRHILAFPMFVTGVWLFWLVGRLTGVDGMGLALLSALLMALCVFVWQKKHLSWKIFSLLNLIACIYIVSVIGGLKIGQGSGQTDEEFKSEKFTVSKMENYVGAGENLFIYFTADWCVTCKINEQTVLRQDEVFKLFKQNEVTVLKGDMTRRNPEVVRALHKFGRIGVPLYIYYKKGTSLKNPVILPQILTVSVMERLF